MIKDVDGKSEVPSDKITAYEFTPIRSVNPLTMQAISLIAAFAATGIWVSFCVAYMANQVGMRALFGMPPHELGLFFLGVVSVPMLIWTMLGYARRLQSIDAVSLTLARNLKGLSRQANAEERQTAEQIEAVRRESLSLFEAAQTTLTSLRQIQGELRKDAQTLQISASSSALTLKNAGQSIEAQITSVAALGARFDNSTADFGERTSASLVAFGAALSRVEEVERGLTRRLSDAAIASEALAVRSDKSAEGLTAGLAAMNETANLLESRADAIRLSGDTLKTEIHTVDERLKDGINLLHQRTEALSRSGERIMEQSGAMARAGQDHVAALEKAANGLGEKTHRIQDDLSGSFAQIGQLADDVAHRLEEASGRAASNVEGIRQNVSEASNSLDRFAEAGDRMGRHRRELDETLNDAVSRLDDLSTRFDGQMNAATATERAIADAAKTVVDALVRLRAEQESTTREIDAFGERSQGVSVRLDGLRMAALAGAAEFMSEADRLQRRSESLTDELRGQSGVLGDAMTRAADIAEMLRATGTVVTDAVGRIGEVSQKFRSEFHGVGHEIDAQGGRLEKRAEDAAEVLKGAGARIADTVSQIDAVLGGLDRRASEINFAVASSLSRLGELGTGLERSRADAAGSSEAVSGEIEGTLELLRGSIERMRETAREITGASATAAEAGDRLVATGGVLRERVQEIASSADHANHSIRQSAEDLSHSANRTRAELEAIVGRVQQENAVVTSTLTRISDVEGALRAAGALVEDVVARATKSAEEARSGLHAVGREIGVQSKILTDTSTANGSVLGRTREQMEEIVVQVQEAFTNLNRKSSEINFAVSTAVNRLGEMSRGMEEAKNEIDVASDHVSERMIGASVSARAEFEGVNDVASRALERLERTLSALAASSANAEAETQAAEQRMRASLDIARQGGEGFAEIVTIVIEDFAKAEQALVERQTNLTAVAAQTTNDLLRVTRELSAGGMDLNNTATASAERIGNAASLVETRLQAISMVSEGMQDTLTAFATELGAVAEQSGAVTQMLSDRGHVLRDNIVQIVRTADDAGESLKASTAALLSGVTNISDAAARTKTELVRATSQLREEGTSVAETGAESLDLLNQASALLGEKAREMVNAAQTVAGETVTMRQENARTQRDLFLTAAKTVLEGLQSLSVDLSRVLDRDLPAELREELTRGDIQSFVARLAGLRDQVPSSQLRARFANDTIFRTHVQTYLGRFEELLAQAMKVDQGEVLTSTLISSDVGKIYYFLAAAVGTDRDDARQTG